MAKLLISLVLALFSTVPCTPIQTSEIELVQGINNIRIRYGLSELPVDYDLSVIARYRARDLAEKNYFSHSPPDGCNYICLMEQHNLPIGYVGEIIAMNNYSWNETSLVALQGWETSPSHLNIVIGTDYTKFGVGTFSVDDKIYHVAIFSD